MEQQNVVGEGIKEEQKTFSVQVMLDAQKFVGAVSYSNAAFAQMGQGAIIVDFGWVDHVLLAQIRPTEGFIYKAAPVARVAIGLTTAKELREQLNAAISAYEQILRQDI